MIISSCKVDDPTEPIPDKILPSVAILAPVDDELVSDKVNIVAQVSDNVGVTKLEFLIDSNIYKTLIKSPWKCEWDVTSYSNGSKKRLNAVAYDAAGNTNMSTTITVEISNPLPYVDTISPANITDLIISKESTNTLTLNWTAPGDDDATGTAYNYEIKYATTVITDENYSQAISLSDLPSPQPAGHNESFTVTGLLANETYYFAMKTGDEVQNISGLSNIAVGNTKMELFAEPIDYPVVGGSYPNAESILSVDIDGDGYPDIAAAAKGGVSVIFNNGAGSFGTPVYRDLGVNTTAIVAGDFDLDGDNDLAVTFLTIGSVGVTIMLNQGNGNIQETYTYTTTSLPREICTADLNGDGYLDLIIAHDNYEGGVLVPGADVLLGNGNATFQSVVNYPVEGSPRSVSAGDFDGDNDLIVSCYNQKMAWVLWNNGNGTFQSAVNVMEGNTGDHSLAGLAADLNADGFSDIAVTNDYPDNVNIFLGNGNSSFDFKGSYDVGDLPTAIVTADYDGDGIADLATSGNGDSNASVILGNGDGSFQSSLFFYVDSGIWEITTADYDQDGDFDLGVLSGYRIFILLNTTIN